MSNKKGTPEVPGHSELNVRKEDEITPNVPDALADAVACRLLFAAMTRRLTEKRREGRHGWHDPAVCSIEELEDMFDKAQSKIPTNWLDVSIFAMMIWQRRKNA